MNKSLTASILYIYYKIKPSAKKKNLFYLAYNRTLDAIFCTLYSLACDIEKPRFGLNKNKRDIPILVSLTSYPQRFNKLHLCLRSLLNQDTKPDKIVLWLSKEQCSFKDIPASIKKLIPFGIEIRFVDNDEKSFKKFLHVNEVYDQSIVICVDDDIIFPKDLVSKLLKCHETFPDCVCANRAYWIEIKNGKPDRYTNWKLTGIREYQPSHYIMPTTGYGTLYNSSTFDDQFIDYKLIQKLCPTADDLWCKYKEIQKNIKVVLIDEKYKNPLTIWKMQRTALYVENIYQGKNDEAVKSLEDYFSINWDNLQ